MGYSLRQLVGFEDDNPCSPTGKGCNHSPPPLRPRPPPTSYPGESKTPHHKAHQSTLILACSFAFTAFLLLLTYYLLLRLCSHFRRRSNSHITTTTPLNPQEEELGTHGSIDGGGNDNGSSFHHVWYIRTVGLDDVTISSIEVSAYKSDSGVVDGTDCSVCLSEFEEGELVKLLPRCSHAFHVSCIDTWLRAHVNCPLCRTPVVSLPPPPQQQVEEIEEAATGSFFVGGDTPLPSPLELRSAPNRIGSFSNSTSSSSSSGDGGDDSSESGILAQTDPSGSEENWVTIDLSGDDDDGQHQHLRRSVSVDALAIGDLASLEGGEGTTVEKGAVASEKGEGGRGVDRCQSTNGRRFFFPRFAGGRKSSVILPL